MLKSLNNGLFPQRTRAILGKAGLTFKHFKHLKFIQFDKWREPETLHGR